MKSKTFYYIAASLCLFGIALHEFAGAPLVLPPLQETELPNTVIWMHYFSWHTGGIFLAGFAAVYFYCGRSSGNKPFAIIASLVFLGLGVTALTLAIGYDSSLWESPAPYFWFIVAFFGLLGVKMEKSN